MLEKPRKYKYGRVFLKDKDKVKKINNYIYNYKIGLKALENGYFKYHHFKSIRMVLKFLYKKNMKVKYNLNFCCPITKKPEQTRMGKGKGKRTHWEALIKKGSIIIELWDLVDIPLVFILKGLFIIKSKLPMNCRIVKLVY